MHARLSEAPFAFHHLVSMWNNYKFLYEFYFPLKAPKQQKTTLRLNILKFDYEICYEIVGYIIK